MAVVLAAVLVVGACSSDGEEAGQRGGNGGGADWPVWDRAFGDEPEALCEGLPATFLEQAGVGGVEVKAQDAVGITTRSNIEARGVACAWNGPEQQVVTIEALDVADADQASAFLDEVEQLAREAAEADDPSAGEVDVEAARDRVRFQYSGRAGEDGSPQAGATCVRRVGSRVIGVRATGADGSVPADTQVCGAVGALLDSLKG